MSASAGELARITLRVRGLLLDSASQALLELSASPASEIFRGALLLCGIGARPSP